MNYEDINSELCIKCGECCKIFIPVRGDERYFSFLEQIGLNFIKDNNNNGRIYLGYCKNLVIKDSKYLCKIYNNRPQLCIDFNCLAWASYTNLKEKSEFLSHARKILCEQEDK